MRRAAPFLPLPGLAVLTDCARSIWSPIPISIPAKGHIGGRSELNGGLRVITSVAAIDPSSNESPEWAVSAGVFWGAMQEQPVPRVGCRITFENLSQRTASGKSGEYRGGGGRNRKDVPRSPAVFMLTSMDPPPTAKPTFPTSRASSWWGRGSRNPKIRYRI